MEQAAPCEVCGNVAASLYSCSICGKKVCRTCFMGEKKVCTKCAGGSKFGSLKQKSRF